MDLIKALTVIRDECRKHKGCTECPLSTEQGECKFEYTCPSEFNIERIEKNIECLKHCKCTPKCKLYKECNEEGEL